jgi:hypothetical protein
MKFLKLLFSVLAVLIAAVLILAAVVPSKFEVARDVVINNPKTAVYDYVVLLKNQDQFSVWAQMDPHMQKEFKGTDGSVGFISSWKSDSAEVGSGEQEIMAIDPGKRIDYELRFKEPWESTSPAYITVNEIDSTATKVVWGFKGEMPYPMGLALLFMDMEEQLGGDLSTGLSNLKSILEKDSVPKE